MPLLLRAASLPQPAVITSQEKPLRTKAFVLVEWTRKLYNAEIEPEQWSKLDGILKVKKSEEWERRFFVEPHHDMKDALRIYKDSDQTSGDTATIYLVEVIEQKQIVGIKPRAHT